MRVLLLVLALTAAPLAAQDATPLDALRLLHTADVEVKAPGGGRAIYRFETTYDPVAGTYTRVVTDTATGEEITRDVSQTALINALPFEASQAESLIRTDPEIAGLIDQAKHEVVVSGGFAVTHEEGRACGPGSRCAMFDVYEIIPGERVARRIRFVVVDLRTMTFVTRDADPETDVNRSSGRSVPAAQ